MKNIPEPLLDRLRAAADLNHRSIHGEILACLERSFGVTLEPADAIARARELRRAFRGAPLTLEELRSARDAGRR